MKLKDSWARRRGVTAKKWYGHIANITGCRNVGDGLNFSFVLPSKGGGNTTIELVVASGDLRTLLRELARQSPRTAKLFATCTQTAVSALVASVATRKGAA